MQKKLTILWAFAIFVLFVGWAITPAQADKPNGGKHNHGGDDDPPTATVNLALGMDTTGLQVTVIQDNFKKIHFQNQNFGPPHPGILMNFGIPPKCFVSRGEFTEDDKEAFVAELNKVIDSGSFVVEVDRKKNTGILVIQYTSDSLGQMRIKYGMGAGFAPVVTEDPDDIEGDTDTFHFEGTIIVWQTEDNNADQKILACTEDLLDHDLHVDVTIHK